MELIIFLGSDNAKGAVNVLDVELQKMLRITTEQFYELKGSKYSAASSLTAKTWRNQHVC